MEKSITPLSSQAFDLSGRVCVIIGGGLIGGEFARRCALHGAKVVVADLDQEEKAKALCTEIGATFIECDTTSEPSVKHLAQQVQQTFGRVDGVVNAAYPRTDTWGDSFESISYEDFLTHVGLQTGPQFLTARTFGALMQKQGSGSLVFVGSIYGVHAPRFEMYPTDGSVKPTPAEYAVAKGGLLALTKYLAKFYGPFGIRVNMLSPGGVEDNQHEEFQKQYNAHAVLGNRLAVPEDLSPTLVYLFADASRYVTGQNVVIDGGWTL